MGGGLHLARVFLPLKRDATSLVNPPAGRHRSGWERLPLAMCVSVFLVGMVGLTSTDNPVNVVHSCGIGRSRGKVQLAGPRSAD
jgi:hypothetical protein